MRKLSVACFALLVAGCGVFSGPDGERHIAFLMVGDSSDVQISVPDSVQAGQDFTVIVRTFGPDGCWRKGRTEVAVQDLSAIVTPFDIDRRKELGGCTDAYREFTHMATLSFGEAGMARVTIRGRDPSHKGEVLTFERMVDVE